MWQGQSRPTVRFDRYRDLIHRSQRSPSPQVGDTAPEDSSQLAAALPTASSTPSPAPVQNPGPTPLPTTDDECNGAAANQQQTAENLGILGEESKILSQISRDHLQCPVCLDTIRTKPIFQCINGHTICSACIRQLNSCPLCRCCILGARIRNRALETLMDHVRVTCPYQSKGCKELVKSSAVKEHMLECAFGKFILCPALGFNDCHEPLCYERWMEHLGSEHSVAVLPGRHPTVSVTYVDFMSTKTVKDSSVIKWQPFVITPFPDAGPFLILCELDVLRSCTAKFVCIYSPPTPTTPVEDEQDLQLDKSYFVEFCVGEPSTSYSAWMPAKISWKGKSTVFADYMSGSSKGVFKIPLSQYRILSTPTGPELPEPRPAPTNADANSGSRDGSDIPPNLLDGAGIPPNLLDGAGIPPNLLAGATERVRYLLGLERQVSPPPPANPVAEGGNEGAAAADVPVLPPRRRPIARAVKQDLRVKIRITKTAQELEAVWPSPTSGFLHISNNTIVKKTTYPRTKCNECKESLRGIRYKCIECPKFELCMTCMNEKQVHSHHIFLYIQSSEQNAKMTAPNFKRLHKEFIDVTDSEVTQPTKRRRTPANRSTAAASSSAPSASNPTADATTPAAATSSPSENGNESGSASTSKDALAPAS